MALFDQQKEQIEIPRNQRHFASLTDEKPPLRRQHEVSESISHHAASGYYALVRAFVRGAVLVIGLLAAVVLARTALVASRQPEPAAIPAAPAPTVDLPAALSTVLKYRDVTDELHGVLASSFPRTLDASHLTRFGGSLLIELRGPDSKSSSSPAAALYAHLDVVPAAKDGWTHEPFAGVRDGDLMYGRGALDDKSSALTILAAAEALLASGWAPARPIFLILGHDEETGGSGAIAMAAHLRGRNIRFESLLDEGGAIVDGKVPGLSRPAAAVAVVEKGYLDLEICAALLAGHSSTPPPSTSIGLLAEAIRRLEASPPARSLHPLVRDTLTYAASEMSFGFRALVSNLWLTGPLVRRQMEKDDVTRALLGTTQAVTMVAGGVKPNVLPARACATANYRLLPGVEPGSIARHAIATIDDERVSVSIITAQQAPAPSDLGSPAGRRVAALIRAHFPDAVVVPVISPGVTDSRHFAGMADQVFRFLPAHLSAGELASMHGPNERISAGALQKMYEFYVSYLRAAGGGS